MSAATNTAPVKWAQRKDSVYLTITLSDVKDHNVELTNDKLVFSGQSNGKPYSLNLEFVRAFILYLIFTFNKFSLLSV